MRLKLGRKGKTQALAQVVEEEEPQCQQMLPDSVMYHILCSMGPKDLVRAQVNIPHPAVSFRPWTAHLVHGSAVYKHVTYKHGTYLSSCTCICSLAFALGHSHSIVSLRCMRQGRVLCLHLQVVCKTWLDMAQPARRAVFQKRWGFKGLLNHPRARSMYEVRGGAAVANCPEACKPLTTVSTASCYARHI